MIAVERLRGGEFGSALGALSQLRMAVFRAYPYLYEGSLENEREYLRGFASARESTLVLARDGTRIVGAATATPLLAHGEETLSAVRATSYDPQQIYYFGESVLLPEYRGQGIGHAFFDHREAAARELGFKTAAFCAVDRASDDPRRPHGYRALDRFWTGRGYEKRSDVVAVFAWQDVGDEHQSEKRMVFWFKELA